MYTSGTANADMCSLCADYDAINACTQSIIGRDFSTLCAVEIGFGSKPYRISYFNSRGVAVYGIDLDKPVMNGTPAEFFDIAQTNGWLRASKSCVRHLLFERSARRAFLAQIHAETPSFVFDKKRLVVGNAVLPETWNR